MAYRLSLELDSGQFRETDILEGDPPKPGEIITIDITEEPRRFLVQSVHTRTFKGNPFAYVLAQEVN